ncbi:YdcH family protein [Fulvimarina sp. 2208YS6-2-32]|uniref:YdcH family protein n=1 Tax=Fulvimarina uroteuthidis TaxID=3098149 RepID=A0ABU5HX61_9HYPH|nr:YdcH family protein [Fulvimarina sp. 2208YS6-2-32]MDY8107729.1 YdcH family protein [Fulvimarina sp. 2208YS6-2-32]
MSLENHIAKLEQRHSVLDANLAAMIAKQPATSDAELKEMKLRKLQLKDQIERLRGTSQ